MHDDGEGGGGQSEHAPFLVSALRTLSLLFAP